jgi:PPM family protein phosphatase
MSYQIDNYPMVGSLSAAGATDVGRQRDHNEDRLHVDADRGLFMVIDGVGGHAAGETAADIALRMLRARLERETGSVPDRIREALTIANNEILRAAGERPELEGMSCVATVAMIVNDRAIVGHIGDSRLYKLRRGEIRKVTPDHAPVGEREDRGELSEAEAMRHPRRNEIYRDLGSQPHTPTDEDFIEIIDIPFEPDSALLLCTDGLTDLVSSAQLSDVAYSYADDPPRVASDLVDLANRAGGKDNISVIFVAGERFAAENLRAKRRAVPVPGGRPGALARVFNRWTMLAIGIAIGLAAGLAAPMLRDRFLPFTLRQPSPLAQPSAAAAPRTLVVGSTPDADFPTIAAALAAAAPHDTIEVEPGEYAEQVRMADTIVLVSRVRHQARLVPAAGPPRWTALTIEGGPEGGGRVSGFAIAAAAGNRLAVGVRTAGARVELDGLDVTGAEEAALAIEGKSEVVVRSSRIHDNPGAGIVIRDSATPQLIHNYVTDNGRDTRRPRANVDIDAASRPVFQWNVISGSGGANIVGLRPEDEALVRGRNVIAPATTPAGRGRAGGGGRR